MFVYLCDCRFIYIWLAIVICTFYINNLCEILLFNDYLYPLFTIIYMLLYIILLLFYVFGFLFCFHPLGTAQKL